MGMHVSNMYHFLLYQELILNGTNQFILVVSPGPIYQGWCSSLLMLRDLGHAHGADGLVREVCIPVVW